MNVKSVKVETKEIQITLTQEEAKYLLMIVGHIGAVGNNRLRDLVGKLYTEVNKELYGSYTYPMAPQPFLGGSPMLITPSPEPI